MKSKNIIIIIISIILILAIAGVGIAYLYISTDFMKSNKVLFAKYIDQDLQVLKDITQSTVSSTYKDFKNTNNYESETNVKIGYSEGGEISNPINNLSMKIDSQRNRENEYFYSDAQILFANEEFLEIEALKDQKTYGVRFSDVVKQFFSLKDDENIEAVSTDLNIDKNTIYSLFDILDGKEPTGDKILSGSKINDLKDKYIELVVQYIDETGTYSKLKNSIITVNNSSLKTNAYMVTLTSEQVKEIAIKLLNSIKDDEVINSFMNDNTIISTLEQNENIFSKKIDELIVKIQDKEDIGELKITVYEKNGTTIRTIIENGVNNIVIDSAMTNEQTKVNIQRNELNTEQVSQQNIQLSKKKNSNGENYNMEVEIANGEEKQAISISNEMQQSENAVNTSMKITYTKDIITASLEIENTVNAVQGVQERKSISQEDNVILNDLNEETRKKIISILNEKISYKFAEKVELLKTKLGMNNQQVIETTPSEGNEMSQIDINRFNAKFEFYTGDSVTSENVKALLENVKSNLKSVEFPIIANTGNGLSEQQKEEIKLNIEKDKENSELIKQVEAKIQENKKYKVTISYNDTNGIIDYITISEEK